MAPVGTGAPPRAAGLARRGAVPDDCALVPGQPPPEPLERNYQGVARAARCQREVFTIMGGVTHFLGVACAYCHDPRDYRTMTPRKRVANWMASELVPRLHTRAHGSEPWCNDCHQSSGGGKARILGDPRDEAQALEWMTLHMNGDFESASGTALHCRDCHSGDYGTTAFRSRLIPRGE